MKVVVIGAGIAGLGIGWRLTQAGAGVTLLERAQIGAGATAASAGMIAVAAEIGRASTPETAFARHASDMWPAFAEELQAQSGTGIDYRRNGALIVTLPGEDAAPRPGGEVAALGAAEALAEEPMLTPAVTGALWAPHEAQVDSQALCRALAVAFVRAGGKLQSNEAVVRIETDGRRAVDAVTPFATYRADAFVLAAGAWISRIEGLPPHALPPVSPVKGEIIVLRPPEAATLPRHVVWGNGIYLVPRGNRLIVGATVEQAGFDTHLSQHALSWLRQQAAGLMPALGGWEKVEHWAGLRPVTPDGMPVLGPTSVEGLYVATGQYRNGILFAPAVAEVLSSLVLERAADVRTFDPRRFEAAGPREPQTVVETPHRPGEYGSG